MESIDSAIASNIPRLFLEPIVPTFSLDPTAPCFKSKFTAASEFLAGWAKAAPQKNGPLNIMDLDVAVRIRIWGFAVAESESIKPREAMAEDYKPR